MMETPPGSIFVVRAAAILVLAVLWSASSAAAQPTEAEDQEARALFNAGEVAFQQGRFERALDYFEQAHALSQRPVLLFNIGNLRERVGDAPGALEAYRAFLEQAPDSPNAPFARNRITALEEQLAAEEPSAGEAPPDDAGEAPPDDDAADSAGEPSGGGPSVAGIALLVVGGALIGGGVGTLFWWLDRTDATDQCMAIGCMNPDQLASERDLAGGITVGLFGVGVLAAVVGGVLLAVDGGSDDSARIACSPSLGGIGCRGRF